MIPGLIAAGSSLLGGLIASGDKSDALAAQERMNAQNIALQREFAQSGIQWKAADAKKAGIHPLYALGAQTHSFAPVSVGGSSSSPMGAAVSAMGQDISRAMNATRSAPARDAAFDSTVKEMQLQNMTLQNDLLSSQIQRIKQQANPPMPTNMPSEGELTTRVGLPEGKLEGRTQLYSAGRKIKTYPGVSDANEYTNRYGEGLGDWVFGPYIAWMDYNNTTFGTPKYGPKRPSHALGR